MRRHILASLAAAGLLPAALPAHADAIHGVCFNGTTLCADINLGGGNAITTIQNSPGFTGKDFGFVSSGNAISAHDLLLVFGSPNNVTPAPQITISGTIGTTSVSTTALSSTVTWTGNGGTKLETEIPNSFNVSSPNPSNPLSNALGFTNGAGGQTGVTGYNLYFLDLGAQALAANNSATTVQGIMNAMDLTETGLPLGSVIYAYVDEQTQSCHGNNPCTTVDNWIATANSGSLGIDALGGVVQILSAPEPTGIAILGVGLLGLGFIQLRRRAG
jgi:hypothetical protein